MLGVVFGTTVGLGAGVAGATVDVNATGGGVTACRSAMPPPNTSRSTVTAAALSLTPLTPKAATMNVPAAPASSPPRDSEAIKVPVIRSAPASHAACLLVLVERIASATRMGSDAPARTAVVLGFSVKPR